MRSNAAIAYQNQQIMTASPAMLVALLYQRAIRALSEAIRAAEQGDIEGRFNHSQRAGDIITHLWGTLDETRGGEIAANLGELYRFMLRRPRQEPRRRGIRGGGRVGGALAAVDPRGGGAKGRTLGEAPASGTKVWLAGCDPRLLVEVGDPLPGAVVKEPLRVPKPEPLVLTMKLLERTEDGEESLSEPRVAFRSDSGFSTKSGFEAGPKEAFSQVAEIHGLPLDLRAEDESLLFAVFAAVTRTPAGGGPSLVARRAETFRLQMGKPLRWTVDSSWDGGRAAIVLELLVDRMPARR